MRLHAWTLLTGEPPDRALLFSWGENQSDHGAVYLDRAGAARVLRLLGTRDTMIDLEHLSLDKGAKNYDPDARGWARAAITERGLELVGIRWTDDGSSRIVERRQRYLSPAFFSDANGRIVELVNVALTALPASRFMAALIAASKTGVQRMDPKVIEEAIAAIAEGNGDAAIEILKAMLVEAAAPESEPEAMADAPPEPAEDEPEAMADAPPEPAAEAQSAAVLSRMTQALADGERRYTELSRKFAAMSAAQEKAEREAVIATNRGKLPGKLASWAREVPMAQLRSFLASAPDISMGELLEPEPAPVQLSRLDRELSARLGTDLEQVQKIRERDARRNGGVR